MQQNGVAWSAMKMSSNGCRRRGGGPSGAKGPKGNDDKIPKLKLHYVDFAASERENAVSCRRKEMGKREEKLKENKQWKGRQPY